MHFVGEARRLSPGDVTRAAEAIGCDEAAVRAVMKVEARSSGFGADGRPIILTEPHILYRELGRVDPGMRTKAVRLKLAASRWGAIPYPRTQASRYKWLEQAMALHPAAALRSCSWGLGQVMGFNHGLAGFDTVTEFVEAMKRSEGDQLMAMVGFIINARLDDELRRNDWAGFARGYNGPGYRKNAYDTRMARWAAHFRRDSVSTITAGTMLRMGARGAAVKRLQRALGIKADGDFGPITKQAVIDFQKSKKLAPDGIAGRNTLTALKLI